MRCGRSATVLVTAVLAVLAAVLTGCSSGGEDTAGTAPAPAASGTFPVTVPTAFGDVTIPAPPRRVVALGWSDAETALALGVQPVGASDWLAVGGDGLGPWVPQRYTAAPARVGTLEVDLEAVAALAPDLILDTRASGTRERHDQLASLGVPVVGIPAGGENYLTPWRDQLRMVGAALGRPVEATALATDLENRFRAARDAHPELAGRTTVSAARNTLGEYSAYAGRSSRVEFLRELGMVNAPAIESRPAEGFSVPVSREQMTLMDADVTVMQAISGDTAEIDADPLWRAVPSVAAGRGILLADKDVSNAFSSASVQGWAFALDRFVGPLSAAAGRV